MTVRWALFCLMIGASAFSFGWWAESVRITMGVYFGLTAVWLAVNRP